AKWRTFRQRDRSGGRFESKSQRSRAIGQRSLDASFRTGFFDFQIHMTIAITGHQVTQPDHASLVCFAAHNFQSAQPSTRLFAEPRKHTIAREKKFLTENLRKSGGPQFFSPYHGYGQKAVSFVGVHFQSI